MKIIIQYIIQGRIVRQFYQCPSVHVHGPHPSIAPKSGSIKEYLSEEAATAAGWKKTKHKMFCEPNKPFVWVCPDCAKEVQWKSTPRRTKVDRRIKERRVIPCFIDKDRRTIERRVQDRRGKAQRLIEKKCRKDFQRHLDAQR